VGAGGMTWLKVLSLNASNGGKKTKKPKKNKEAKLRPHYQILK
jgi:hypothetical protein